MAEQLGTDVLKVVQTAAAPALPVAAVCVFALDVAGTTQLFAIAPDGTVSKLTPNTDGDFVGKSWFFSQGT
jgi:hypothetical protein